MILYSGEETSGVQVKDKSIYDEHISPSLPLLW